MKETTITSVEAVLQGDDTLSEKQYKDVVAAMKRAAQGKRTLLRPQQVRDILGFTNTRPVLAMGARGTLTKIQLCRGQVRFLEDEVYALIERRAQGDNGDNH